MDSPSDHSVINTSRGIAQNTLVEDRKDTAASSLADGGTNSREAVRIGGCRRSYEFVSHIESSSQIRLNKLTFSAVKVRDTKDIRSTALCATIETRAGNVHLSLVNRGSEGNASQGGSNGRDDGEAFHDVGLLIRLRY